MAKRLIYVGQDDDVSDLAGKVQAADAGDDVGLVVPAGGAGLPDPPQPPAAPQRGHEARPDHLGGHPRRPGAGAGPGGGDLRLQLGGRLRRRGAGRRPAVPGQPPSGIRRPRPGPGLPSCPGRARPPAPGGDGSVAGSPAIRHGRLAGSGEPSRRLAAAHHVPRCRAIPRPGPPRRRRERRRPPGRARGPRPAPPPGGPVAPAPVAAVAQPRARSPWTTAGQDAEWDQPPPPWAAGRAPDGYGALPGATVLEPPPPVAPSVRPPAPPGRGPAGGPTPPPAPGGIRGLLRNRPALYGIGAAVVVVAFVLFLVLGSSATVTVTIAEQPLTVNPTIQGTAVAAQASQPNYVLTKVISDTATQTFPATPTGSQAVPAVAATGTVDLTAANFGDCIQPGPLFFRPAASSSRPLPDGVEVLRPGESPPPTDQSCGNATYTHRIQLVPPVVGGNSVTVARRPAGTAGNVPTDTITLSGRRATARMPAGCSAITVYNPGAYHRRGQRHHRDRRQRRRTSPTGRSRSARSRPSSATRPSPTCRPRPPASEPAIDPGGNGKSITYTISPSSFPPATAGTVMSAETVTVTMNAAETRLQPGLGPGRRARRPEGLHQPPLRRQPGPGSAQPQQPADHRGRQRRHLRDLGERGRLLPPVDQPRPAPQPAHRAQSG